MRLDRALANSGYGSRSEIRKLIRLGQVTVAGEVIRDPAFPLGGPAAETVRISGQERLLHDHLTVMLNKPAGCVTAMEDSRLPTVADLLPPAWVRTGLVPVGRLDRDTTGLLLLTNDGTLNHRLASPRWGVWKIYRFRYDGPEWTPGDVAAFAAGLTLPDGRRLKPARLVPRSGGGGGPHAARRQVSPGQADGPNLRPRGDPLAPPHVRPPDAGREPGSRGQPAADR